MHLSLRTLCECVIRVVGLVCQYCSQVIGWKDHYEKTTSESYGLLSHEPT